MADTARFSVSNQKGGVGKSTVAINVAGALGERGREVLFVDLDPQGNATENLGFPSAYEKEEGPNLFDCLTDAEKRPHINDLILKHELMDVVPSHIDMTAVEPKLTVSRRGSEQLDLVLDHVEKDYDYIVVDSPPNLGNLTDNALHATQNVLIPALSESTSKRAFELLFDHISMLELDYEIGINEVGVVINRIDIRKNQAKEMVEWIETAFDDVPVYRIRERAAIQNALEEGGPLVSFESENDMADEFRSIAENLDRQFGLVEEVAPR